ncbi:MAG: hypothetical protein AB1797_00775 [bacterium]
MNKKRCLHIILLCSLSLCDSVGVTTQVDRLKAIELQPSAYLPNQWLNSYDFWDGSLYCESLRLRGRVGTAHQKGVDGEQIGG